MSSNKRREQQSRTVSLDDFHFESLAYVKKMTRAPESQSIGILPVLIFDLPPSTKQFVIINPTESIETKKIVTGYSRWKCQASCASMIFLSRSR